MTARRPRPRAGDPRATAAVLVGVLLVGCAPVAVSTPAAPTPVATSPAATPAATPSAPPATRTPAATPSATASSATPAWDWRAGKGVKGVDVSRYQASVDWDGLAATGHRFAYVKATEGTGYVSPRFAAQWAGARRAGLLTGAYHYARPAASSAAAQVRHLLASGGRWRDDGRTLPAALDLEFSASGDRCHGLSRAALAAWVGDFVRGYRRATGRSPVLYTSREFWDACAGGATPAAAAPLWLFDHGRRPGALPGGWTRPLLWQRAVEGGLDRDVFLGDEDGLRAWARMG